LRRSLSALERTVFDVVIVGGGITGACLAHDGASRGLAVALVERCDFGGATSAASSKILHGGIRYLQQFRFDKVRESARERGTLRRIAPHLVRRVPFLIPIEGTPLRGHWPVWAGLALYTLLGGADEPGDDLRTRSGTYLDRAALEQEAPALAASHRFKGALVLNEYHLHSSERMTLAFLKTAVRHGAVVANYVTTTALVREGTRVVGMRARTPEGDEIRVRARITINAAGPWLPGLNEEHAVGPLRRPVTGFAQGVHIITRQLLTDYAAALPTSRASGALVDRGGRHVFVIPWRGHSLIGTSNRPFRGEMSDVRPMAQDVSDLLDDVNRAMPSAHLDCDGVRHAFAGLYPLITRRIDANAYQGTGDYQIVDHERDGTAPGFVSVLGSKFTTARRVAELAMDLVCRKLGRHGTGCRSHQISLVGSVPTVSALRQQLRARYRDSLAAATIESLVRTYGAETDDVLRSAGGDRSLLRRLSAGRETIEAEVVYAVEHEMAQQLSDVVFRRTGLGTLGHPGEPALERCATLMAAKLEWTKAHRAGQLGSTRACFPIPPA